MSAATLRASKSRNEADDAGRLSHHRLFVGLNESELETVQQAGSEQQIPAKAHLLHHSVENSTIYLIVSGTVYIVRRNAHGAETVINILGEGDVIGEMSALEATAASADAVAVEDVTVICFSAEDFRHLLDSIPALSHNLLAIQNRRLRLLTDRVEAMRTLDVAGRFARELLLLANHYSNEKNGFFSCDLRDRPFEIPLRLTQGTMANLIGASGKQVHRVVTHYVDTGAIHVGPRYRFTILSPQQLLADCQ